MSWSGGSIAFSVAIAVASVLVLYRMIFSRKNQFPVEGLTAVVTGGSSGLGLSICQQLASKGANVVMVAQDKARLASAIKTVQSRAANPHQKFLELSFDLRSPESAPEILKQITQWNDGEPPDLVFCCAGNSEPAFFADASIEVLRRQMDTVYWTSVYMAHEVLNLWKKPSAPGSRSSTTPRPTRHIIFACSTLAFFPVAGYSPYTPAKAAMRAMVDGLHQEVAVYNGARQGPGPAPDADINVHIVFPMGIYSRSFEYENSIKPELTVLLEEDDKPQQPDEVANILFDRLAAGDYMITTMFLGHLMRGCGMSGSLRKNFMDIFWNWLGSIVILFVAPDFIAKCKKWGKQKGLNSTGPASKS